MSFLLIRVTGIACITLVMFSCNRPKNADWRFAGGDAGQTKYAALTEINTANVQQLQQAWVYHSGNKAGNVQCTPLIVDGTVYITTPAQELLALDGATGQPRWKFNPSMNGETTGGINRGLAYWQNGDDKRILYTVGKYLYAIYTSGKPVLGFGDSGRVNMNEGLIKPPAEMGISSPGAPSIYKNWVIVGATTWSGPANVSAYDVVTGKRVWVFNTIPQPGEFGYDSWGDSSFYRSGRGVNVWGGICVDEEEGLVFFATGQPKDDFTALIIKGCNSTETVL